MYIFQEKPQLQLQLNFANQWARHITEITLFPSILFQTHSGYTDHCNFTLHAMPSIKPYHRGLGHLCQIHCTAQYLGGQSRFCHRKRNQYTLMVPKWRINKEINISIILKSFQKGPCLSICSCGQLLPRVNIPPSPLACQQKVHKVFGIRNESPLIFQPTQLTDTWADHNIVYYISPLVHALWLVNLVGHI